VALIYRSLVQVADEDFLERTRGLFDAWASKKVGTMVTCAEEGAVEHKGVAYEFGSTADADAETAGLRARLYEDRGEEQVRLTVTALSADGQRWLWTDVERWTEAAYDPSWIPYAPRLVVDVLKTLDAHAAGVRLPSGVETFGRDAVDDLVDKLFDEDRSVPVVVVSPTREEREDDIRPCLARADELQRRLTGVALIATLAPGATGTLSKALTDRLGPDWDVHSGAVRTYLPGLGAEGDARRRHRFVPYRRLAGRPPDTAARLIAVPLVQASCLQPPPTIWRDRVRRLPAFAGATADADLDELLGEAEAERDLAIAAQEVAELRLAEDRETVDEVMGQLERLTRRVAYLESELEKTNAAALHTQPAEGPFDPDFCEEVAEHAAETLPLVGIGDGVLAAAANLDVHTDCGSWARKAWRCLQALQAYAETKAAGDAQGWDFKRFCEQSGHPAVIPASWVAPGESKTTDTNKTFRALRTLPVPADIDDSGALYMPAHIRVEKGGTPCPRIHFHDDTDGTTGKIHVGWFGDHLDSRAKS
jgi:hypothetical protein